MKKSKVVGPEIKTLLLYKSKVCPDCASVAVGSLERRGPGRGRIRPAGTSPTRRSPPQTRKSPDRPNGDVLGSPAATPPSSFGIERACARLVSRDPVGWLGRRPTVSPAHERTAGSARPARDVPAFSGELYARICHQDREATSLCAAGPTPAAASGLRTSLEGREPVWALPAFEGDFYASGWSRRGGYVRDQDPCAPETPRPPERGRSRISGPTPKPRGPRGSSVDRSQQQALDQPRRATLLRGLGVASTPQLQNVRTKRTDASTSNITERCIMTRVRAAALHPRNIHVAPRGGAATRTRCTRALLLFSRCSPRRQASPLWTRSQAG